MNSGVYNEEAFAGLDYIIERAGFYGIKLILTFSNEWTTADSKVNYLEWGNSTDNSNAFFTDQAIQQFFKDHINTVVNRNVSLPMNYHAFVCCHLPAVSLHSFVLLSLSNFIFAVVEHLLCESVLQSSVYIHRTSVQLCCTTLTTSYKVQAHHFFTGIL